MLCAINARIFPAGTPPREQIAAARRAGFDGIELMISGDGPLTFETPARALTELRQHAADEGVAIIGLASGEFFKTHYASPSPAERDRARELTLRMLDAAAALGGSAILVIPAVVGRADEAAPRIGYADALARSYAALVELGFEAEARGVIIGLENVWNRFLLSPVEAADLIDRVNSPWVGLYFDVGNIMPYGYPQDWIATLGGRLRRVHVKDYDLSRPGRAGFCGLGEGSVHWPAVMAALRSVGYDGPITYEGDGDPAEVRARLRRIVAGEPPLGGAAAP